MKKSFYLGKIKGIEIRIHWTFLILILWIFFAEIRSGKGWEQGLINVGFILTVFSCVVLHELGHALAAMMFGYKTQSILLLPIGGIAQMKALPEKPIQELIMAVAGPFVNVIIATVLGIYLALSMQTIHISEAIRFEEITSENFLLSLVAVNVMLVLFNCIPAFPMDGGRILRALISFKTGRIKATKIAAIIGQLFALVFIVAGFLFNTWLIFIGIFIFIIARAESGFEEEKHLLDGYSVGDVTMHKYTVLNENDPLSKAVEIILDGQEKDFLVMNDNQVSGVITRDEIIRGLAESGNNCPVKAVMKRKFFPLTSSMNLKDIFARMTVENVSVCPVMDKEVLIGVVNLENIGEFLLYKKNKPD